MKTNFQDTYILPLHSPQAMLELVGGKGASLSRLAAASLPVPDGFFVTTTAYRRFVKENNLQTEILAALEAIDSSQPAALESASATIQSLFANGQTPADVASAIIAAYTGLAITNAISAMQNSPQEQPALPVAVRSSATAEDMPEASFAGQQETYLNISGQQAVLEATKKCWASLWTARAIGYRARQGIPPDQVALAVVVQLLVPAETAGILFTANPVTRQRDQVLISASWGLGEAIVNGVVTPDHLIVEKASGRVLERQTAKKQVMTVRVAGGTEEHPVPDNLRHVQVLNDDQAANLVRLGMQIENLYRYPQDIEWAIAEGKPYILQSRPITTLNEPDTSVDEQNATDTGDFLWTNMIVGEVFPMAMTPSTWSVWEDFFSSLSFGDIPSFGRIAGRPYLNYSLTYSFLLKLTRKHERVMSIIKDTIGLPPSGMDIPTFPIPWRTVLFQVLPSEFGKELKKSKLKKSAPAYLAVVSERCQLLRSQICETQDEELISLWRNEIKPLWNEMHILQDGMNEELQGLTRKLKAELSKRMGENEANALLSTISNAGELASLGPLVGLSKLRDGTLSRNEYLRLYGHRGPQENELAAPRPHEDQDWIDRQLMEFDPAQVDLTAMLEKREAEFNSVRQEIARQLPVKVAQDVERKIAAIVEANSLREATRSELTRIVDVIRSFFIRGGVLSGLGEGVFFLTIDELIAVLSGNTSPAVHIPGRRQTFEQYCSLPPLPGWIRGRFDPLQWAADRNNNRGDFDGGISGFASGLDRDNVIRGHPGSAGRVEGVVCRIDNFKEGYRLQPGDILVTGTTNVGWTPLFPRVSAVVTDVGGSLSHAAIVTRELGIPSVVGCGDATIRLKSGDRVLVDGSQGIVEVIEIA